MRREPTRLLHNLLHNPVELRDGSRQVRTGEQRAPVPLEASRDAWRAASTPVVLADAGAENVNAEVDALIDTGVVRRLLAFTELKFSNSMIEAWWCSLKHQWLFLHPLELSRPCVGWWRSMFTTPERRFDHRFAHLRLRRPQGESGPHAVHESRQKRIGNQSRCSSIDPCRVEGRELARKLQNVREGRSEGFRRRRRTSRKRGTPRSASATSVSRHGRTARPLRRCPNRSLPNMIL
jgi:hypothetical protein